MTSRSESGSSDPKLDRSTVSHLLGMAAQPSFRPADALANRLREDRDHQWVDAILDTPPNDLCTIRDLLRGTCSIETLKAIHRFGKKRFHEPENEDDRNVGLLWYLIAVGLAMTDHRQELSSQPRSEVVESVLIVADALPEPWRSRLAQAGR